MSTPPYPGPDQPRADQPRTDPPAQAPDAPGQQQPDHQPGQQWHGQPGEPQWQPGWQQQPDPQARKRRLIVAGAVLGVVVIAAGMFFALMAFGVISVGNAVSKARTDAAASSAPTTSPTTSPSRSGTSTSTATRSGSGSTPNATPSTNAAGIAVSGPASPEVTAALAGIPASAFDGAGSLPKGSAPFVAVPNATPLTVGGKPQVVYVGAEFCPFCAGQRWALAAALERFGDFSGLGVTASSSTDAYPDTATLDFRGSTYSSQYVAFSGWEVMDRDRQPTGVAIPASITKLATDTGKGAIPWMTVGGRSTMTGAAADVSSLQGLTQQQIATQLADPNSTAGSAILPAADLITAQICQSTGQQPANVCTSPGVTKAAAGVVK